MPDHATTAAHLVVNLPELVHEILGHLWIVQVPTAPFPVCVNKLWFRESIAFLWRHCKITRLISVGDTDRRQLCAASVRSLIIDTPNISQELYPDVPRLQSLNIAYPKVEWIPTERLVHNLRLLELNATVSQRGLYLLSRYCSNLSEIHINRASLLSSHDRRSLVVKDLQTTSNRAKVGRIRFSTANYEEVFEDFLCVLQTFFEPQSIVIERMVITQECVNRLLRADKAFGNVQHLNVILEHGALRLILPHLHQLTRLTLTTKGDPFGSLKFVASLQHLQYLEIVFEDNLPFIKPDVLQVLPDLPKLQRITISNGLRSGDAPRWVYLLLPTWSTSEMLLYLNRFLELETFFVRDQKLGWGHTVSLTDALFGRWTCEVRGGEKIWSRSVGPQCDRDHDAENSPSNRPRQ